MMIKIIINLGKTIWEIEKKKKRNVERDSLTVKQEALVSVCARFNG